MPDPKPVKPRRLRPIVAMVGVALVLLIVLTWVNRRSLAREALTGWLKSRGVAARAEVETFGLTTFTARLTLGDPKAPDFTAEQAEVRYRMTFGGMQVQSVRLRRPVLRASLHNGRFSLGSLDPLVQAFLRAPPPTTRQPRITVENGLLVLATDYGPVRLAANAVVDDSKLVSLAGTSAPVRLKGPDFDVEAGAAAFSAVTANGRVTASVDAPVTRLAAGDASARNARLRLKLEAPYPDLMKRKGDGALLLTANATGRRLAFGGRSFDGAELSAGFVGQSKGWISDLAVTGRATANLKADGGKVDGAGIGRVATAVVADDVRWTRAGGDRVTAKLQATATATNLSASALRADTMTVSLKGPVALTAASADVELTGSALAHGRWDGLGPIGPLDQGQMIAVKRAARGFRVAAPAIGLHWSRRPSDVGGAFDTSFALWPAQPIVLRPDNGGEVRLSGDARAFRLVSSGGGLPQLDATVSRLVLGSETSADLTLKARASAGMAQGAAVDAAGRVRVANGAITFTATRCATVDVARLDFGAPGVERLSGQFCPAGGPMLSFAGGDWRIAGRAAEVKAAVPFAEVRVSGGAGRLEAASRRGRLSATADITAGRLEDTAAQGRFAPVTGSGHVSLANYVWTADLAVRQPGGPEIGRAHLVQDTGLGVGFVTLDSGTLTFADGGLQPGQLSPMASAVGSPATGQARFQGRFDWARQGAGSSGTLSLKSLGFQSPAGRVEGLSGEIVFASLAPLVAAPGQGLDVESVQAIVPLTHLHAKFALADNLLKIEGGEALVGGGRIRVESLEMPLVPGAPTRGTLVFEAVQLHDLVEATPFADKVDLDAKVSGQIKFESQDGKVRIEAGELKAIQPGRLSIDRTALTGVTANTATPPTAAVPDPNATFTDFAYQAMENLAFEQLTATIATRNDGRLGVLFHIVGKHDPPTKQKIKLSIMDLLQKRFLGRTLPLPSGTGVNLTLDTSLNLDDLLADYANFRKLHGSGQVQP